MNSNQFSFKNLLQTSSISQNNQSSSAKYQSFNKSETESVEFYKQKYLETKQNVKKFIQMVEQEFERLTKSHNEEKQRLQRQILQLKKELNQKKDLNENDVSNFTARSKKSVPNITEKSFSNYKRSGSNEAKINFSEPCFDGIEGFGDQSKIMNQTTKSFAVSSKSQILTELQNALNHQRQSCKSRITQKSQPNHLQNMRENDLSTNSLNVNEYKNHILSYRKSKLEQGKLREKQQNFATLEQKNENVFVKNEQKKEIQISRENFTINKGKQNTNTNDSNLQDSSKRPDSANKVQQASVRNMLKNLRNTMRVNIEKESKLEAPMLTTR